MSIRRVLIAACLATSGAWRPGGGRKSDAIAKSLEDEVPETDGLIGYLGHALYDYVDSPKYQLMVFLTTGYRYNERTALYLVSTLCNWLYGLAVFWGFIFLPRGRMLFLVLVTFPVGPSIVLVLLGAVAAVNVAFATHPMASVATLWTLWFASSRTAQWIGLRLGLDRDGDGDVDWLDLLAAVAKTRVGDVINLSKIHEYLNARRAHPFHEIFVRLDRIEEEKVASSTELLKRFDRLDSRSDAAEWAGATLLGTAGTK